MQLSKKLSKSVRSKCPSPGRLIGYKIVEDLEEWKTKTFGLTKSADIVNLREKVKFYREVCSVEHAVEVLPQESARDLSC